jgi:BclB C-terminal domain-containing protein
MTTALGGLAGTSSLIAFGASAVGVNIVGGVIDTSAIDNMAFSIPRSGTIESISAFFSTTTALALVGSTVSITAQLYASTAPDNTFAPIPGAAVTLTPALSGVVAIGTVSSGTITGLSVPVTAGTRLLMVFSAAVTAGLDIATAVLGYASAGVGIS